MDTSVTIIGLVIMALIGIPLFYMLRANAANNAKMKAIFARFNNYHFSLSDTQNKKALAADEKNKGFIFVDFNVTPEEVHFVDLREISTVKLIQTTEGNSNTVVKIEFEFLHKQNQKKQHIPFYKIENDQIGQVYLYEDQQLAKKWEQLITNTLLS
ncbi:hypothetical protein FNO01nite_13620 [Flavobacterium noncentrifugens]|uniref:Uncharacterized protein n=1 Tax=Flavobacterium noncentrifugens TaxID=1128970 RepID=A0A1G8VZD6_9FLAO|nr:hypothetical protein [Flavobacterium noncentrifugens]GEP50690.1 hypothetical protein FNO01nite_13620 [Flavobacterium noncentrifugens]SDJ70835.1 hypothetical protein SAMN04487935_1559 [Flavobacterium noncentrifugens]